MSVDERLVQSVLAREVRPLELPHAEVYRGLVRGNLRSVIRNAFPVTIEVEGDEAFDARVEDFLEAGGPTTSLYRDIPGDVVDWALESGQPLADLMHYEWLELVAARHPADLDALADTDVEGVRLNPTLQFGMYQRQVHLLSAKRPELPEEPSPVVYLVWRRPRTDELAFHRIGLLLARALAYAQVHGGDRSSLIDRLMDDHPELDRDAIVERLGETLDALAERDGIL